MLTLYWPLLYMQLKKELERITHVKSDEIKSCWSKWAPKTYEQGCVEASTSSLRGSCAGLLSAGEWVFFL